MKDKAKNWRDDGHHPTDGEMLGLRDGELEMKQAEKIRLHLEACWGCRARSEKFQIVIASFVEYRQIALLPSIKRPESRNNFQNKLNQAANTPAPTKNIFRRWKGLLGIKFNNLNRNISNNLALFNFAAVREILTPRAVANSLTAAVALVCIVTVYFAWFANVQRVSAEELLDKSENAAKNDLQIYGQPVVYRQIEVSKKSGDKTAPSIRLELWQDTVNSRLKQSIIQDKTAASEAGKSSELIEILRSNGFEPSIPLSVTGFRSWRNSLAEKIDKVDEINGDGGITLLKLETQINEANAELGKIVLSSLTVRQNDFHPVRQSFTVKTQNGPEEYEVRESSFAVLDLASLKTGFFDEKVTVVPAPSIKQQETPGPSPEEIAETAANSNAAAPKNSNATVANSSPAAVADANLEIEVTRLLSSVKADMGEQVEVKRTPNGPLVISGIVDDNARKTEIINSLATVTINPAVKIEILTVEEAVSKQKQNNQVKPPAAINVEGVEVRTLSIAAEPQLREYFGRQGGDVDNSVRSYATGRVAQSRQAMQHLGALKKLANQFSPEQLKTLEPGAREKWLTLIRTHARAFQDQNAALRRDLRPVFFAGAGDGGGKGANVSNDADLIDAIRRLYNTGAANDAIVRSAFTASGSGGVSAVGAPQFWQSLKDAEVLAQSIQNLH